MSIDAEKALDIIQHPFIHNKISHQMGIEGTYLNMMKIIYNKPTAIIILNSGKLKTFLLNSETRQGSHFHCFYIVGFHSHSNQTRKRNRMYSNWKGGDKTVTTFRQHETLYREP